jgi:AAA domain
MQRSRRQAVFVSGAPGAGKTSLAVPLAAELGFALVSKDRIKETLHDTLGAPEPDLAWSQSLGAAAMELLWALAADAPSVVVEANFRPRAATATGPAPAIPPTWWPASPRACWPSTTGRSESGSWSPWTRLSPSTPRPSPPPSARPWPGGVAAGFAADPFCRPALWCGYAGGGQP